MLRVVLVLWYKDGMGKPSYSFDLRERVGQLKVIRAMESSGRYGEKYSKHRIQNQIIFTKTKYIF